MSGSLAITGIAELITNEPGIGLGPLGTIAAAAVVADDGVIVYVGASKGAPAADVEIVAGGRSVIPGFVDSHTHLVFAGDRTDEFSERMAGRAYAAGGIARTVEQTRAVSDAELLANARRLVTEARSDGTTTIETKSGYGLTINDEERSLRVARQCADEVTFLGAHVVPDEFAHDRESYVELVAGTMLDACAPLSGWCDVFCDEGAFSEDESERILNAGGAKGLGLRIHANQLSFGPGARLAARVGAASADHLNHLDAKDIAALKDAAVVATLCPGADFSTKSQYADGRALLEAGVTVALASDCNPGTSFTTSMPFVIALAVRECGLNPEEALAAGTLGGARALRRDDVGRIAPGARADLVVLDAPSHVHLAYRPGVHLVDVVVQRGEVVVPTSRARDG
ncbi:MAG: imidazolonepropionase [Acidimicrobiales bacterium]